MQETSFSYPELEQITYPTHRVYKTLEGDYLPSVTTILSKTKDMTVLNEWREKVGDEEADKIIKRSTDIGTQMHNAVEDYLNKKEPTFKKTMKGMASRAMFHKLKKEFIEKTLQQAIGIEAQIYYPGLYAGTVDLIAIVDDELIICDYKNSRKIKKREWCEDYFIQGASYIMAHDELFGTNIKKFKVIMVSQPDDFGNIEYIEYTISGSELEEYKDKWIEKLEKYFEIIENQGIKDDAAS